VLATKPVLVPPTVAEVVVATAKISDAPETWVIRHLRLTSLNAALVVPDLS
jgi:hypothetical protein